MQNVESFDGMTHMFGCDYLHLGTEDGVAIGVIEVPMGIDNKAYRQRSQQLDVVHECACGRRCVAGIHDNDIGFIDYDDVVAADTITGGVIDSVGYSLELVDSTSLDWIGRRGLRFRGCGERYT